MSYVDVKCLTQHCNEPMVQCTQIHECVSEFSLPPAYANPT